MPLCDADGYPEQLGHVEEAGSLFQKAHTERITETMRVGASYARTLPQTTQNRIHSFRQRHAPGCGRENVLTCTLQTVLLFNVCAKGIEEPFVHGDGYNLAPLQSAPDDLTRTEVDILLFEAADIGDSEARREKS